MPVALTLTDEPGLYQCWPTDGLTDHPVQSEATDIDRLYRVVNRAITVLFLFIVIVTLGLIPPASPTSPETKPRGAGLAVIVTDLPDTYCPLPGLIVPLPSATPVTSVYIVPPGVLVGKGVGGSTPTTPVGAALVDHQRLGSQGMKAFAPCDPGTRPGG